MQHQTVLLAEAVEALSLQEDSVVVDATFGSGGHAREIISRLGRDGVYVGIDADQTALESASLGETRGVVHLVNDNFSNLTNIISDLKLSRVDAILADLGWRMEQFAGGGKGFSFQFDEPLLMTFGDPKNYAFTAADIVNEWDESVIANILYGYADERFARRIAAGIVSNRRQGKITTTGDLVRVVEESLPAVAKRGKIHPATRTFQALRIAVNNELEVLEKFIKSAVETLIPGGKLAIITFHSIEDRIVKHAFRELKDAGVVAITPKKPISPGTDELTANPRSRSAKLRVITTLER